MTPTLESQIEERDAYIRKLELQIEFLATELKAAKLAIDGALENYDVIKVDKPKK